MKLYQVECGLNYWIVASNLRSAVALLFAEAGEMDGEDGFYIGELSEVEGRKIPFYESGVPAGITMWDRHLQTGVAGVIAVGVIHVPL